MIFTLHYACLKNFTLQAILQIIEFSFYTIHVYSETFCPLYAKDKQVTQQFCNCEVFSQSSKSLTAPSILEILQTSSRERLASCYLKQLNIIPSNLCYQVIYTVYQDRKDTHEWKYKLLINQTIS